MQIVSQKIYLHTRKLNYRLLFINIQLRNLFTQIYQTTRVSKAYDDLTMLEFLQLLQQIISVKFNEHRNSHVLKKWSEALKK